MTSGSATRSTRRARGMCFLLLIMPLKPMLPLLPVQAPIHSIMANSHGTSQTQSPTPSSLNT